MQNTYSKIACIGTQAVCLCLSLMLSSCSSKEPYTEARQAGDHPAAAAEVGAEWAGSTSWVDAYEPESSSPGYNLILFRRRTPLLMDMDGSVVHAWPSVRAAGRARLLANDRLAVISESGALEEYDWSGQLTWRYVLEDPEAFLHHDFILLGNGNYLLLAHDPAKRADFLLEVERSQRVVWRWNSEEHLADDFDETVGESHNHTHINSVFELAGNRWFDGGDQRFRPGNILISARNLNTIYVVARPEGTVTWSFGEGLDYQHEALMIPTGSRGAGNIVLFNNGYHNTYAYRQSAILELNPTDRSVVWEYRKRGFYSSTGGTQQMLPNGNLLVTSSQGGRVFELTRDGRIVWQWSPPYPPMRVSRYPSDFTPGLEQLGEPAVEPIEARDPSRYVDSNLYVFALPHQTRRFKEGNRTRKILKKREQCEVLQLPAQPKLRLGYGRRVKSVETPFVLTEESPARFVATIRAVDEEDPEVLLDHTLAGDDVEPTTDGRELSLIEATVPLDEYAAGIVELCLQLSHPEGGVLSSSYVWEEPAILAPGRWAQFELDPDLDDEALKQQEKHLKAIGYIN